MMFLQQQLLVLYDQQWPTNAASVRVDAYFSLSDVPDHRDLRHNDVHLPAKSP